MIQKRQLSLAFPNFWALNFTILVIFTSAVWLHSCILSNKADSEESISSLPWQF